MGKKLFGALTAALLLVLFLLLWGCGEKEKPAAETPVKKPAKESFEINVGAEVLAAYLFEDSFFGAEFFPAKVVTKASEETKGKYEVELKYENQMKKHLTNNIVSKWHPAKKEELKVDMVVLFTGGDEQPQSEEELKQAKWRRGVILNTDKIDKDIVTLIGGEYKREYDRHLSALRIVDEAPKGLTTVPEE